jgi:hypothetical protein
MGHLTLWAAVGDSNSPKRPPSYASKALGGPLRWSIFILAPAYVPSSASLSQSTHPLLWVGDLISMAFTCC